MPTDQVEILNQVGEDMEIQKITWNLDFVTVEVVEHNCRTGQPQFESKYVYRRDRWLSSSKELQGSP